MVSAVRKDEASMASAGRPMAKWPPTPGRTISSTPRKPTMAAPIRSGPTFSCSTKAASGTSHSVRVNESALASASGIFWKA